MGQPGVVAASVSNAIVDWSDIGDDRTSIAARMSGKHALDSTTESLLRLRRQLFRRPEQYFDPFASPLLFFRSSSQSVPSAGPEPPLDDLAQLSLIEREDFFREQAALSAVSWQTSKVPEQGAPGKAKRKTSRRYPSPAYGLRLPSFQMSAGTALPFQQQATELAHQARQSFTRQESASSFGRKVLTDDEVESLTESGEHSTQQQQEFMARDKIDLVVHEGQGLWDMSDAGKERVEVTASWLKTKLASV